MSEIKGELQGEPRPESEIQPELREKAEPQSMQEKVSETAESILEQKSEYYFEEMKEIEPAMVSLVSQLKEKIENGEYSSLLSDDVGGRIPTLILRKILREKGPNPNIKAHFLAAGHHMPGWEDSVDEMTGYHSGSKEMHNEKDYEKVKEYFKKLNFGSKKILVVTQYTFHGETLKKIGRALYDSGVKNFDFAIMHAAFPEEVGHIGGFSRSQVFIGEAKYNSVFHSDHEGFSGVRRKEREYSPTVEKIIKHIEEEGRDIPYEEFKSIFGIKDTDAGNEIKRKTDDPIKKAEYERRKKEPLTDQEKIDIENKIRQTREDIKLMAKKIIKEVWQEDK